MVSKALTNKILIFNLVMTVLFILSYQFMVLLFSIINKNSWVYLVFFIGYVPLRGVGFVLMPNFPLFIFLIIFIVDIYYLVKVRRSTE
jgi:hypothetical protein